MTPFTYEFVAICNPRALLTRFAGALLLMRWSWKKDRRQTVGSISICFIRHVFYDILSLSINAMTNVHRMEGPGELAWCNVASDERFRRSKHNITIYCRFTHIRNVSTLLYFDYITIQSRFFKPTSFNRRLYYIRCIVCISISMQTQSHLNLDLIKIRSF